MSLLFYYCTAAVSQVVQDLARNGSTVVEHLPIHPKVKGLSPGAPVCAREDQKGKTTVTLVKPFSTLFLLQCHLNF